MGSPSFIISSVDVDENDDEIPVICLLNGCVEAGIGQRPEGSKLLDK